MAFKDELSILIRARYPYIWLVSHEESRVLRLIKEISKDLKTPKTVISWSSTKGFFDGDKLIDDTAADTSTAFRQITEKALAGEPLIYVFFDLHKLLEREAVTYRLMRDAFEALKRSKISVIIVGPEAKIPLELQKVITVLDVPLPKKEDLRPIVERVIKSTEAAAGIEIGLPPNGQFDKALESLQGLTEAEAENVIARSIVAKRAIDIDELVREKEQVIRKSGVLQFYQHLEGMENVGGLGALKEWIRRRSLAFSPQAEKFGVRPPRGLFLAGPPGTGKSLSAKACAAYLKVPLLLLETARIFGQYVGQSEGQLTAALKTAGSVAPCVLFIDEMEKMFAGTTGPSSSDVTAKLAGILLTWMQERPDGANKVLVIATANNVFGLPPELFSRFDATFWVDLPKPEERAEIFAVQIRKFGRSPKDFDLNALAGKSNGFSGREIEKVVAEGIYAALAENPSNPPALGTAHLLAELGKAKPLSETRKADLDKLRDWGRANALPASLIVEAQEAHRGVEL